MDGKEFVSPAPGYWPAVSPELWNDWGDYDRSKFTVEDFAVGFIKFENGAVIGDHRSGIEVEQQLAGERLHLAGAKLHFDFPAAQIDLQLCQRVSHILQFVAQRGQNLAHPRRWNLRGSQLSQSAQRDQIGEAEGVGDRDQALPFPTPELALGDGEQSKDFVARVGLLSQGSGHGQSLSWV